MSKQIVFVEGTPTVFSYKIAKALKKQGYKTILISLLKFKKEYYPGGYSKIIEFNLDSLSINIKNCMLILKKIHLILKNLFEIRKLSPYITIGVARPYPLWIPALARKIVKKTPFIFFPYDVNAIKYLNDDSYRKAGVHNFEIKAEKYLFQNSDGIIFKGDEEYYVKRIYNIKCPTIKFYPYCSNEFIVPINKNKISKEDGEIHLVHIGSVLNENDIKDSYGFGNFNQIIKSIIDQKIHFHIYTSQYNQLLNSSEYQKLLKNKYLHLNMPINHFEIIKEISKYDYGTHFQTFNFNIVKKEYVETATGNKMSSYFEAGIPQITSFDHKTLIRLADKYNLGLNIKEEELYKLKEMIKNSNYQKLIKNIKNARKDFIIEGKIDELEEFFDKVFGEKKWEK